MPTEHIHAETKILRLREHLHIRGTQFLAAARNNIEHPRYFMDDHTQTDRHIKNAP
jgi:hypothetical protein